MTKIDTSKTTWDLTPLLASDDDPKIEQYRKELKEAIEAFVLKWKSRQDYLKDPSILKVALDEIEVIFAQPSNEADVYYFHMRTSLDSIDPGLKAKTSQANEFTQKLMVTMQFFWLNVGKIAKEEQARFLKAAELRDYHHLLEREFAQARYQLSEAEEKILTLKSKPAHSDWVQMTADAISKDEREVVDESGEKVMASEERLIALMSSKQKSVRDGAAKAFNALLADHLDMGVAEINAILADKKINDELRGYDRPDKGRHLGDDIDTEVVDALVQAVTGRNDIPRRFYALRAKLLGLPKLAYHERVLEIGSEDVMYSYPDACQIIADTFADLDPEFAAVFTTMLERGQLDAFPRKGKRGGAFCASGNLGHPTYVLLNHTDKIRDVSTIAHEMGHAINNELMRKRQNALNFGTSMATAEVASTYMEDFVNERLLKNADPETELTLRVRKLDDMISTIFRQTTFYRFEQKLHNTYREAGYLAAEQIGELFRTELDAYMGETFNGVHDGKNWWLYIPHFRNFFYVYSYASGQLISAALQARTRKDIQFITEVKKFLSTGTSKSPKAIFADMGIDITDKAFWEQGLNEVDQLLKETETLAKKLGKI